MVQTKLYDGDCFDLDLKYLIFRSVLGLEPPNPFGDVAITILGIINEVK